MRYKCEIDMLSASCQFVTKLSCELNTNNVGTLSTLVNVGSYKDSIVLSIMIICLNLSNEQTGYTE